MISLFKNSELNHISINSQILSNLPQKRLFISPLKKVFYKVDCDDSILICLNCNNVAYLDVLRFFNQDCCKCLICHSNSLEIL